MADRSAAAAFGSAFVTLAAQKKTPKRDQVARDLWKAAGHYDFSPGQMEAYHALAKLGLLDVEDEFEGKGLPKTPDYAKASDRWSEKFFALIKKRLVQDGPDFEMANKRDAREIARIAGRPAPAWTKETHVPTHVPTSVPTSGVATTLSRGFAKPSPVDKGPGWGALALAAGLGLVLAIDSQRAMRTAA